ncbi:MAG: imidazolonepropionase [Patescibacteria group bacterium]
MKTKVSTLIISASQLLTMNPSPRHSERSRGISSLGLIEDGATAIADKKIVAVGKTADLLAQYEANEVINANGKVVTPGLIDCHTHLIFAGTREYEYLDRLRGKTYLEILERGGGILSTVRKVRAASKEELINHGRKYLAEFLSYGVTTVEIKSGYGLDYENEKKMLEVINELKNEREQEIIPTFMGAHTFPAELRHNPKQYIKEITDRMLPDFRGLAENCDVFVEKGAFSVGQTDTILGKAQELGYKIKLHTNQISALGGIELARKYNAVSVEHLDVIDDREIDVLAKSGAIAVLLPGASFFLQADNWAPMRKLLDKNVPVAISTDFNPGSCPSTNLHLMMNLAAQKLNMLPDEVWRAVTINAAQAIDRNREIGSLEVGKKARIAIWNMPNYLYPLYHFGYNFVEKVVI